MVVFLCHLIGPPPGPGRSPMSPPRMGGAGMCVVAVLFELRLGCDPRVLLRKNFAALCFEEINAT